MKLVMDSAVTFFLLGIFAGLPVSAIPRAAELPLEFVTNEGHADPAVEYTVAGRASLLSFTKDGLAFELSNAESEVGPGVAKTSYGPREPGRAGRVVFRLRLEGRSEGVRVQGIGSASTKRSPRTFGRIVYEEVYPGIDLVFSGQGSRLKYEFHVMAGADPAKIRLAYEGIEGLALSDDGGLVVRTALGELTDERPFVYQPIDGDRVPVEGGFSIVDGARFGFAIARYDGTRPLVIDPVLSYSSYLGGTLDEWGRGIAVDSSGSAYVTGDTTSTNFPTQSAYKGTVASSAGDAFVTKFSPSGSSLVYSTYLGGSFADLGYGIAVDTSGAAYVTGLTGAANFPVLSAYQATFGGGTGDGFVTKLSASGSALAYSTYLGGAGDDKGYGIAVVPGGNAVVTGSTTSTNFPTASAYQGTKSTGTDAFLATLTTSGAGLVASTYLGGTDAFLATLTTSGAGLVASTYLGGTDEDVGRAVDLFCFFGCSAYLTGYTASADFPILSAYQSTYGGGSFDAFVSMIDTSGPTLVYSTYLGGSNSDLGTGIAVPVGRAYVTGQTLSSNYPTTGAYQGTSAGGFGDAFVTKLGTAGDSLVYSTYLGGSDEEYGNGIAVDSAGGAYAIGTTKSTNFPKRSPYQSTRAGTAEDVFVAKLAPSGSSLAYSTYLGGTFPDMGYGIAVDSSGAAYATGRIFSPDFPTKNPYQGTAPAGYNAFAAKFPGTGVGMGSADYNGDHQDEVGVLRNGVWFMTNSNAYSGVDLTKPFGSPTPGTDSPEIGEFNCVAAGGGWPDGQTDIAILRKAFSTWQATVSPDWGATPDLNVTFGTTSHKRIATRRLDTNGDGCSDIGVFRNGCFDVLESPLYGSIGTHACFGLGTDVPLAADLNGDGIGDLILWRSASSHYSYRLSPGYSSDSSADLGGGDLPLIGDLDGDGRADLGSFKQTFATFRFTYSPDFVGTDLVKSHGVNGDIPLVADVNGDGVGDVGIFRNSVARWWFKCSPAWTADCVSQSFGVPGDVPVYGKPPGMP